MKQELYAISSPHSLDHFFHARQLLEHLKSSSPEVAFYSDGPVSDRLTVCHLIGKDVSVGVEYDAELFPSSSDEQETKGVHIVVQGKEISEVVDGIMKAIPAFKKVEQESFRFKEPDLPSYSSINFAKSFSTQASYSQKHPSTPSGSPS